MDFKRYWLMDEKSPFADENTSNQEWLKLEDEAETLKDSVEHNERKVENSERLIELISEIRVKFTEEDKEYMVSLIKKDIVQRKRTISQRKQKYTMIEKRMKELSSPQQVDDKNGKTPSSLLEKPTVSVEIRNAAGIFQSVVESGYNMPIVQSENVTGSLEYYPDAENQNVNQEEEL